MKEHVLSLNDFNMPKVYEESDANYILIIRLLLLDPGKYQTHPTMGVGLKTKFRFADSANGNILSDLQSCIKTQISKFLPEISYRDITLTLDDNVLGIIIETNEGGSYVIGYDTETENIEAAASYVLDNL
jgi:hypothetical protein